MFALTIVRSDYSLVTRHSGGTQVRKLGGHGKSRKVDVLSLHGLKSY